MVCSSSDLPSQEVIFVVLHEESDDLEFMICNTIVTHLFVQDPATISSNMLHSILDFESKTPVVSLLSSVSKSHHYVLGSLCCE